MDHYKNLELPALYLFDWIIQSRTFVPPIIPYSNTGQRDTLSVVICQNV